MLLKQRISTRFRATQAIGQVASLELNFDLTVKNYLYGNQGAYKAKYGLSIDPVKLFQD